MKNKKLFAVVKIFISLFVVYHLLMVAIIPNRYSMLFDALRPYLMPYAHTLAMDSVWGYYAPNPIIYFYFRYEVIKKNSVETYRWPPTRQESKRILFNHIRFVVHSQYFFRMDKNNIRRHFIPYLCRLHPMAKEIAIKIKYENRPHFKKAKIMDLPFWPVNNKDMKEVFITSSRCRRSKHSKRDISSIESSEEDGEEEFFDENTLDHGNVIKVSESGNPEEDDYLKQKDEEGDNPVPGDNQESPGADTDKESL